jgi:hypothetical protein
MEAILWVLVGVPATVVLTWIAFHLGELDEVDQRKLAEKRRWKVARAEYSFVQALDGVGKVTLPAKGGMVSMDLQVSWFPAWVAAQLKGKKHEWVVIGFAKQGKVEKAWANKGPNNSEVSIHLSFETIGSMLETDNVEALIILHNHPNPDPGRLRTDQASEQDLISARKMYERFGSRHLVEFVCERGNHHEYWRSIGEKVLPLAPFLEKVREENKGSFLRHLAMHIERAF